VIRDSRDTYIPLRNRGTPIPTQPNTIDGHLRRAVFSPVSSNRKPLICCELAPSPPAAGSATKCSQPSAITGKSSNTSATIPSNTGRRRPQNLQMQRIPRHQSLLHFLPRNEARQRAAPRPNSTETTPSRRSFRDPQDLRVTRSSPERIPYRRRARVETDWRWADRPRGR